MVKAFIQMLIARRIAYLVAPYEADSEMAYLCRTGIVDAVVSEDSDTICYRCPRVLTKMDVSGHCLSITLEDVFSSPEIGIQSWDCDQLELMCVLSGCDYLKSLPQIGLKTAKKYVDRGRSLENTLREIAKVPKHFPKDSPVTLFDGERARDGDSLFNGGSVLDGEIVAPFTLFDEPSSFSKHNGW